MSGTKAARFILTGASGFVGTALARHLAQTGERVVAIDRVAPAEQPANMRFMQHDLVRELPDAPEFRGSVLVHAGALMNAGSARQYWDVNATGTFNVLEFASRNDIEHLVFFSTGGVYPYAKGVRHAESGALAPIGFYGHSKLVGETTARAFHEDSGMPLTIIRLFFPYGPGQRKGVVPLVANAVRNSRRLVIKKNGSPRMNPVHIQDLVESAALIIDSGQGCRVFNLCGDEEISFLELVRMFEAHQGRSAVLEFSEEDQGDLLGDNTKLKRELGWAPKQPISSVLTLPFES